MTIDFRNSEQAIRNTDVKPALLPPQRMVLVVLGVTGLVLFLAGVWLLVSPAPWFKPNVAPMIALALILTGICDACAVVFLRWTWLRAAAAHHRDA